MRHPLRLVVADVRAAARWYAAALDGQVVSVGDDAAELHLGGEGIVVELARGPAPPPSSTPVLELRVDDLPGWVDGALAQGALRATPVALDGYAQLRDPFGWLWAFRARTP